MSSHPVAETIESHGCSIVLRRVEGPEAAEFFLHCRPSTKAEAGSQTEAMYRAILAVLEGQQTGFGSIVCETLFIRDMEADLESIRAARGQVIAASDAPSHRPATTEIEQPPLDIAAHLEVLVQAVIPGASSSRIDTFDARPSCGCAECAGSHGLQVHLGDEARLYAGALCGRGENAYEQTLAMFGAAEALLQQAGMEFTDVVRTWIHLRDIDRDYDALNQARRAFFGARGVDPVPASTGIGGGPVPGEHDLCLGIYAVKADQPPVRTVMTSPTLNEAASYGADFVRGMKMVEANKIALHVSGTASIDEAGSTVHVGDFEAQADRMLVNIAALLQKQGASFDDVVSAITYLKHPADAARLREKLNDAGFEGFPIVEVEAPVCRPELLCETEALAVLPRDGGARLNKRQDTRG